MQNPFKSHRFFHLILYSFYKEIMNSFHKTFLGLRVLRKACEDKVLREAPDQQPRQRRLSVSSMRKGRQSPSSSGKTHQELSQRVSLLHQFHFLIKHLFLIFILLCFIWLAFLFIFFVHVTDSFANNLIYQTVSGLNCH